MGPTGCFEGDWNMAENEGGVSRIREEVEKVKILLKAQDSKINQILSLLQKK